MGFRRAGSVSKLVARYRWEGEAASELQMKSGLSFRTRNVVVATGLTYFRNIPGLLSHLPSDKVLHAADVHDFQSFRGQACRGPWWRSIRNRFSGAPKRSTGKCSACFAPAGHLFQWSVGRLRQAPSANAARVPGVWDRPGL